MLRKAVSDFHIEAYRAQKDFVLVESRYEFLQAHKGIRPGCLHGIMGTMGCGKSTLVKCIIAESAKQNRILIWLSEETVEEYQELIHTLDKDILCNIRFVQERDIHPDIRTSQETLFEYFEQMVEESGASIVFIDNVTTSLFYNSAFGLSGQNRAAEFLRGYPKRTDVPILYVAHTASYITDNYSKVVNAEDIRGSKELPMVTEYFYIIQKFTTNEKQYNVLRTAKYRHHEDARGWYALKYEKGAYIGDGKVPFSVINQIFRSRDFLGRKDPKPKKKEESKDGTTGSGKGTLL